MDITQFPTQTVEVGGREPIPGDDGRTNNADAQVTLSLGWGLKTGNPAEPVIELHRYVTSLDPAVAIQVGESMADAGRELLEQFPPPAKTDLLAATPAMAAQAAKSAEALTRATQG